ncbi:hypothetical protein DYQ86_26760 [Acidobacteria bacterium AB60]|nr:hypothetical protein DYQ86_26760 [Acidobacteria bacterium AB60]
MPRTRKRHAGAQKPRVLQISDDQNLAITRLLLLQNQGYSAEHVFSRQVAEFAHFGEFEIFLICQSIESDRAREYIGRIRREVPAARVLRVRTEIQDHHEQQADLSLAPPAGPFELLRGLEWLSGQVAEG